MLNPEDILQKTESAVPPYQLIRSQRRTLSLEITPDGTALIRAPLRLPQKKIDDFVVRHAVWIEEKRLLSERKAAFDREHFDSEEKLLALKKQAEAILPQKLACYAVLMGVSYTGIRITDAKKRFGSCNSENSICFSLRLMAYPEPAWDYVVVHELAHIRYKNHGRHFYELIEHILPDYKMREALLRFPG